MFPLLLWETLWDKETKFDLDNDICISLSCEEDSLRNERHKNLSCPFSPRENIIEQDNEIIDEEEKSTIDNSLAGDKVILEEPTIKCHEHI